MHTHTGMGGMGAVGVCIGGPCGHGGTLGLVS